MSPTTAELHVYLNKEPIGTLYRIGNGGDVGLAYDSAYRDNAASTPLSLSLPLARTNHQPPTVAAFLWGLLPDNKVAVDALATQARTSAGDIFGLIRHVGRDVAGAAQFLPPDTTEDSEGAGLIELTPSELAARIADLRNAAQNNLPTSYDNGRWSLAGAQAKIALRYENGHWFIPEGREPSTHIVKPAVPGFEDFDVQEAAILTAAGVIGLRAAPTTVIELEDGTHGLVSVRYDRARAADGTWTRIHQEDLCQALGYAPAFKYETEGGPGIDAISRLLTTLPGPDSYEARSRFFDALVLSWAIGATDGHAKNYSLVLSGGAAALAPLYDINSAIPYTRPWGKRYANMRKLHSALRIGTETAFTRIKAEHWQTVARQLRLKPGTAIEQVERISREIGPALAQAYAELADKAGVPADQRTDWPTVLADYRTTLQSPNP